MCEYIDIFYVNTEKGGMNRGSLRSLGNLYGKHGDTERIECPLCPCGEKHRMIFV